jgi:hypothetical protein
MSDHLTPDTRKILVEAGLAQEIIEFLAHLSYCASALNNSKNPKQAAFTLLEKPKIQKMYEVFLNKKVADSRKVPDVIEKMTTKFRRQMRGAE